MNWIFKLLRDVFLFYFALCFLIYILQRSFIYFPEKISLESAFQIAKENNLSSWYNKGGVLLGWKYRSVTDSSAPKFRILIFHGNAGHALHRTYLLSLLHHTFSGNNWEGYILEYPGYGAKSGKPTEASLREAAFQAINQLMEEQAEPIILLGESLGCAVAASIPEYYADFIQGIILITPFNRLSAVAHKHYPWLLVTWLLRDKWKSDSHLNYYSGPVAFILADKDEVIPRELGEKLYEKYSGRKRLWIIPGTHNHLEFDIHSGWNTELLSFLIKNEMR